MLRKFAVRQYYVAKKRGGTIPLYISYSEWGLWVCEGVLKNMCVLVCAMGDLLYMCDYNSGKGS